MTSLAEYTLKRARRREATQWEPGDEAALRHARDALERDKREALDLAVKARWGALAIIAVLLPFINPTWEVVYYEALLLGFAAIGWAQRKFGQVGQSRAELTLIHCDLILMLLVCIAPNPFAAVDWPLAMQYRFDNFIYFFVLLAGATLAYSWRTVVAMGTWVALLWILGILAIAVFSEAPPAGDPALAAYADNPRMVAVLDPYSLRLEVRVQEIVVFCIVAVTLAIGARRASRLLLRQALLERERSNLARYFSPNVVEELSHNDEPLKQVRNQTVAVLFVDIVGFTAYAQTRSPEAVIGTLRGFHGLMEQEVFRHQGTLDKYLGDGLMATFGTPSTSGQDAVNALACARAMQAVLAGWNAERAAAGEETIRAGFGLHYGPVVLGDIGANRLEFAVIGNTVNIASRLEALTRPLGAAVIVSDDLIRAAAEQSASSLQGDLECRKSQSIRGLAEPMTIWVGR
ncbi:MAG: adenylate/guanylate cyclase domain-containing protein [Kiloniellales bacterium]